MHVHVHMHFQCQSRSKHLDKHLQVCTWHCFNDIVTSSWDKSGKYIIVFYVFTSSKQKHLCQVVTLHVIISVLYRIVNSFANTAESAWL